MISVSRVLDSCSIEHFFRFQSFTLSLSFLFFSIQSASMTKTIPSVQKGSWREIGAAKRLQRDSLIPEGYLLHPDYLRSVENVRDVLHTVHECGLLSSKETVIINSDTEVILENLLSRKWSAVEVTTAFCKSAAVAQQMVRGFLKLG
jgi:amidase